MPETRRPSLIEYAGIRGGLDITRGWVDGMPYLPTTNYLINLKGGGDLSFYEEIARDYQVKSCFQQRFRAVTSKDWEVIPGGEERIDKQAAEHLQQQLENLRWDDTNEKMLWGVFYGYSAAEMIWKREGDKVEIEDIKVRNRRRFLFDIDQKLTLRTYSNPLGEALPERKFWVFSCGGDNDDEPYGGPLAEDLSWPVFFKHEDIRYWVKFVEKYAAPTRLGKYPAGATQGEKDTLWNALASFGDDARSMIPEGLEMEFLESSRAGNVDYKALCDQMDAAISKIILSQTMTTDNGSSRSQAEVHEGVKDEVIESDSDLLNESFNNGPVVWLTDWNFPGAAYPKVRRKIQSDPDPGVMADTDTKLQGLGISLKPEAIAAKYGEDYLVPDNKEQTPQLNGEQVNALVAVIVNATQGGWKPELVAGVINGAFPGWSDEAVSAITGNLGSTTPVADPNAPVGSIDPNADPQPPTQPPTNPNLEDVATQFAAAPKKKTCKTGISCGNTCISALKTCKKPLTDGQKAMKQPIVASADVEVKPKKTKAKEVKPEVKAKSEKKTVAKEKKDAVQSYLDDLTKDLDAFNKTQAEKKVKADALAETEKQAQAELLAKQVESSKTFKSKLLDMANGAAPDSIKISDKDVAHAKKNFMDKQDNEWVGNKTKKMKAEAKNLSDDEALALSTWIGHKYASMNAILYGGKVGSGIDINAVETTDLLAAKALHKIKPATAKQIAAQAKKKGEEFDPDKPLGRYMTVDNPAEFVKRYQDALAGNGEIRESTFFATSHIDRADFSFCNTNTNLTYEVKAKLDGSGNGRYIDHYKNAMSEGEVLYPPETKFRVVAVTPPKVTGIGKGPKQKKLTLSKQETEDLKNHDTLYESKFKATMDTGGKIKGEIFEAQLAKVYQEKTGKPLPSKEEQTAIIAKGLAVNTKKLSYQEKEQELQGGKNRDRNWIVQLEEI